MMEWKETATALLGLVAGISGLVLSWLAYRRQGAESKRLAASAVIEDFDKARKMLREENERLGIQIEHLRKQLEKETLKRVALEERLDIERQVFSERIEALEAELKRLQHVSQI